jgi:adenylate cyclase
MRSEDLIRQKEKKGALISVYGKILVFCIMFVIQIYSAHSHEETMHITIFLVSASALLGVCAYFLSKNRFLRTVGCISLTMDIIFIAIIPFLWYSSVDQQIVSRTFLLKSSFPLIVFLLLIVNTLTLKPAYPLILSIASGMYMLSLFGYASYDPRFSVTDSMPDAILGVPVSSMLYFSSISVIVLCGLILSYLAYDARKTIIASARNEVRNSQLSRYFSPGIAETIMKDDNAITRIGGHSQSVAVMFSDIRNFTKLTESHSIDDILSLLREYHQFMVAIVFEFGGTLDKFIGDGILATFGTPYAGEKDAINSVQAALRMRQGLKEFNADRAARGLFTISHGIGIHYGSAIVGNIGSEDRLEYTVIGDTVNMASRVESSCKALGEDILLSDSVASELKGAFVLKPYDEVSLKGKEGLFRLYGID